MKEWMAKLTVMPVDPAAKTIQISFDNHNPTLCRDVVQVVLDAFFKYEEQMGKQNNKKVIGFVETQLDSLSRVLKVARDSVNNFQRKEKITDPKTESESVSDKVNELKKKLLDPDDGVIVKVNENTRFRLDQQKLQEREEREYKDLILEHSELMKWKSGVTKAMWIFFTAIVGILAKIFFIGNGS